MSEGEERDVGQNGGGERKEARKRNEERQKSNRKRNNTMKRDNEEKIIWKVVRKAERKEKERGWRRAQTKPMQRKK